MKIVEDWKKAIDFNQYTAAVLVDLSKAFDCLPQDLLILKLEAYGLSKSALNLMHSYLSERKQCVKVGVNFRTWKNIYKSVPQGSILGPVLFKIFVNDICNFVEESFLYNYVDDNTLSYSDTELNKVVDILEKESLMPDASVNIMFHGLINLCIPLIESHQL